MALLEPTHGAVFLEARKKAGLSQTELAGLVECSQSAISMFERDIEMKLGDEYIVKAAKILGIDLEALKKLDAEAAARKKAAAEAAAAAHAPGLPGAPAIPGLSGVPGIHPKSPLAGFCPDCDCPSNIPYLVGNRIAFRPKLRKIGRFCVDCGEILETKCPGCGSSLNEGAFCAACGRAYVTPILPGVTNLQEFVAARLAALHLPA